MTTLTTLTPTSLSAETKLQGRMARFVPAVLRILLGLVFFVFGLAGLLHLLPPPSTPIPDGAAAFAGALMASGYMFPMIKGTETLAGVNTYSGATTIGVGTLKVINPNALGSGNSAVTMYVDGHPRSVPPSSQAIGYSITKARGRQPLTGGARPTCQ